MVSNSASYCITDFIVSNSVSYCVADFGHTIFHSSCNPCLHCGNFKQWTQKRFSCHRMSSASVRMIFHFSTRLLKMLLSCICRCFAWNCPLISGWIPQTSLWASSTAWISFLCSLALGPISWTTFSLTIGSLFGSIFAILLHNLPAQSIFRKHSPYLPCKRLTKGPVLK